MLSQAWLLVAMRELREWRKLFLAAAVLSVLPLVLPPLMSRFDPAEVRGTSVGLLILLFSFAVAPMGVSWMLPAPWHQGQNGPVNP